jgi:predicted type IV restriction endonuclease
VAPIPKKVHERLVGGLKKFQPIVLGRKSADVGEADTVILVTELLAELFGYDKFTELTSEFAVKTTYCDLATKVDDKLQTLIEVKSIGHALKDSHVTQAVNYAANQGVEWVVLTNGQFWRAYSVRCKGQIDHDLVVEIDLLSLDPKSEDHLGKLYLLCKEGWAKSAIDDYKMQREALNRYVIGATILADRMLEKIKTELRRVSPDVRIEIDDIRAVIENEVIKRELLEGDKAAEAKKTVAKAASVALRDTTQTPE